MESDKDYWHQYLDVYERLVFSELYGQLNLIEFGVLGGASIDYLLKRFPTASIFGVDIIEQQAEWPKSTRVTYINADQSNGSQLDSMYSSLDRQFDVIIDDGSHRPCDQAICMVKSFPWVNSNGFYILEDIHTSFADRHYRVNSFQLLLAIQHFKITKKSMPSGVVNSLAKHSYFTQEQIEYLFQNIRGLHLFKRTHLPLRCYRCKVDQYDYVNLTCSMCGEDLYKNDDSMSFIIRKS